MPVRHGLAMEEMEENRQTDNDELTIKLVAQVLDIRRLELGHELE